MSRRVTKTILVFDDPSRGKDALVFDDEKAAAKHMHEVMSEDDFLAELDKLELARGEIDDMKEAIAAGDDLDDMIQIFNDYNVYDEHVELIDGELA